MYGSSRSRPWPFYGTRPCNRPGRVPMSRWCSVGDAEDLVFDSGPGDDPTLADQDRLVEPGVALVARFAARVGEEVLVAELGRRAATAEHLHDLRRDLDEPVVLHIDDRVVVSLERGAHIQAAVAIRTDQQPVGTSADDLAFHAVALKFAAGDIEDHPRAKRSRTDLVEGQVGVVGHFLNEFRHGDGSLFICDWPARN